MLVLLEFALIDANKNRCQQEFDDLDAYLKPTGVSLQDFMDAIIRILGDHYRYIVRTEEEEDYIAVSPYSWNEGDTVSVSIKAEDIRLRLKGDLDSFVVE